MHIYDGQISRHYAAYRPPLHRLIMDEVLKGQRFETGLDIGCGTGYSAIALSEKCNHVIAVDNSQAMLEQAIKHHQITYLFGSGNSLPVRDASIELVTLAGVLSYLNTENVVAELMRVCRNNAFILTYDFEVIIKDLMQIFSLSQSHVDPYDHACNLTGHDGISTLKTTSHSTEVSVTEQQTAHILLSDKSRYDPLVTLFNSSDPFDLVVETLKQQEWSGTLKATVYYSLHQLNR